MAKGNDGNYLQHCIEVEVAKHLSKTDSDGRLHVALTHGMAPYEMLDEPKGSIQKSLLYEALDKASQDFQSDESLLVSAYRNSKASTGHYPNSAELLRAIIGQDKLSGVITERNRIKYKRLTRAWVGSNIRVVNSSWRRQLCIGGIFDCPENLQVPWLFSMDPMTYKENGNGDDENLHHSDIERLKSSLSKYFGSGLPGIACFFVYNMSMSGRDRQRKFWDFIDELANSLDAGTSAFWVPHKGVRANLAGLIHTEEQLTFQNLQHGIQIDKSAFKKASHPALNVKHRLEIESKENLRETPNSRSNVTMIRSNQKENEDDQHRIDRIDNWIDQATAARENNQIRFLLYWIAYEAAYKREDWDFVPEPDKPIREYNQRNRFHEIISVCENVRDELQRIFSEKKFESRSLLKLRQADPFFWYERERSPKTSRKWEAMFEKRVAQDISYLDRVSNDGGNCVNALDAVFRNLSIVRNQIVHGSSSGEKSYGSDQVLWGTNLLAEIVPFFRNCIEQNDPKEGWGSLPFPRVGQGPNDMCPPPWIADGD